MPDSTSDDLSIQDARYTADKPLGKGGVGTVHLGRHTRLDRPVVIKDIGDLLDVFSSSHRAGIVKRLEEVSQKQAALDHPHVAQVFDIETDADVPYVVSQYATGGNLRDAIDDGDAPLPVVITHFAQILFGLDAAHRDDAVHGNLKPTNVLFDDAGNVKLTDFGLASLVDTGDSTRSVHIGTGSVAYRSPEQLDDPTDADARSDVYAAGILLYEMITGEVPGRRSPLPSEVDDRVPSALDNLFDRMTRDSVDDRYDSARDVLDDLMADSEVTSLIGTGHNPLFARNPLETDSASERRKRSFSFDSGDQPSSTSVERPLSKDEHSTTERQDEPSEPTVDDPEDGEGLGEISSPEFGDDFEDEADEQPGFDEISSAEFTEEEGDELEEISASDLEEENGSEEAQETSAEPSPETDDSDEDDEDDEILDKLDQYSAMFEDDS
jgi:serine/threonine protein kinase